MSLTVNCNIIFCITQGVKKTPLPIKSQQNVLTDQTIVVISCNQPFIALKFLKRWCVSDLRMHCLGVKGNPANCMCCVLSHFSHFSHIRLFLTLCNLPGSSVCGVLQARTLEWVAISAFRGSSQHKDQTHVSHSFCTAGGFFTTEPLGKPSTCMFNFKMWHSFRDLWISVFLWLPNALGCCFTIKHEIAISLVVQWLRICLPTQGPQVLSLVKELRSHMPWRN